MNNSRILTIKNVKFLGYFYMNWNTQEDFQICISVPLSSIISYDAGHTS